MLKNGMMFCVTRHNIDDAFYKKAVEHGRRSGGERMFEDFGERLRRLRTNAGFTQGKLAQRIGRGVTTISKYESGAMLPTMEVAVELAFQLNVSLDELFGYENTASLSVIGLNEEQRDRKSVV